MQTPTDIMGLNAVLKRVLAQAAGAIVGMVDAKVSLQDNKPVIAVTALGVTTSAALHLKDHLTRQGYDMISFHIETKALDDLVEQDIITGVIDLTTFAFLRIGGVDLIIVYSTGLSRLKGLPTWIIGDSNEITLRMIEEIANVVQGILLRIKLQLLFINYAATIRTEFGIFSQFGIAVGTA